MEELFREILKQRAKLEDIVLTKAQEDAIVKKSAKQLHKIFKDIKSGKSLSSI